MAQPGAFAPSVEHRSTRVVLKAEYIWIDGTEPTARLRSKTKILDGKADLGSLPIWGFDGSCAPTRCVATRTCW